MNDVNTPPTEAVQPKAVKIKKSKKVNAPRAFAVGTILLFIIMFIVIHSKFFVIRNINK